jgi:hypothetical protein
MNRTLQVVAWSYAVACLVAWGLVARRPTLAELPHVPARPAPVPPYDAATWFTVTKPFCNSVEVDFHLRQNPAPPGVQGLGYSAACYALAGLLGRADSVITSVQDQERLQVVAIVFDVAHPVADAGDDRAAGPIMELVVKHWPNHYMALYHAGMSAYTLEQHDRARSHLGAFLKSYSGDDGWRHNAIEVLKRLGVDTP